MTNKELQQWSENATGDFDNADDTICNLTEEIKEFIQTLRDAIGGTYPQDLTWIDHKGETLWIAGGSSFGDSPGETFDLFSNINYLPIRILKGTGVR